MNFKDYQVQAWRTANEPEDVERQLLLWTVALAGEVGEFCNVVKKKVGHGHDISKEKLADELGDCLWYAASLCTLLDIDMAEVAQGNIDKLMRRYPNGFSQADSINRTE
ncbi:MAG: nucleoside triphosphate pyrophosphohydrolase family protein [Anaerolineales bacterium]|nr:nucleoside triphosphate pyrophosphohydrolase family protein [Anaerolineales bacterium]MCB8960737.1 nucleoside triphosphate pyrophosphohydrolase family protein [Ardenticatenales bacterium]